jgi:hypothetical protein
MEEYVSDFDGVLLHLLIRYQTGIKGISKVNWNKMSFKFSLKDMLDLTYRTHNKHNTWLCS